MTPLRKDEGDILITVVLVSMVVGMLAALTLSTGRQADWSSASDRNSEIALAVAEGGAQQMIASINAQAALPSTELPPCSPFKLKLNETAPDAPPGCAADPQYRPPPTPQGSYDVRVTRTADGFIIDSQGTTGGAALGRKRHIKVTLQPPLLDPEGGRYAIWSYTSVDLKNNDEILQGDVWANDSVIIRNGTHLSGSVTAAQSWIQLESQATVDGNVWSGGYKAGAGEDWAINLGSGSKIGGWAKASVQNPAPCPETDKTHYRVLMGGTIVGKLTTWGAPVPAAGYGSLDWPACTAPPPLKPLPTYTFNEKEYGLVKNFNSVVSFESYLAAGHQTTLGDPADAIGRPVAYVITEPTPSQAAHHRVDLTGAQLKASATIVTNAPVFTGNINDDPVPADKPAQFVVVSRYRPPTSTACDVNDDNSECAVHVKNNFSYSNPCKTAVLIYANLGPVAVKNGQVMCGIIVANSVLIKNGQRVDWDARFDRPLGFGNQAYTVSRWEEHPVR